MDIVPLSLSSPERDLAAWHALNVDYWREEVPQVDPPGTLESRSDLDGGAETGRGGLLALDGGVAVGAAVYQLPLHEDLDEAYVWVFVAEQCRRRGHGRALLTATQEVVAAAGRVHLRGDARVNGGGAAFASAVGARSTQVDLGNLLDVTATDASRLAELAVPDPAYALVSWRDRCPDELLDHLARLRIAMNDAPKGDEPRDDWRWDAQRERDREARHARWGFRSHVTAAVHQDSGELAGFTELLISERPRTAQQEDTAVIAAHRGHGLGITVKAANLLRLREHEPHIDRVLTWNAETNRHMRAVNERLGFRVVNRWHDLSLKG